MKEFDLISQYLRPLSSSEEAAGLTDDVSVVPEMAGSAIITTDTLVEHVHFNRTDPMDLVGKKLVRVNVSDCYAKAALPRFALFNLTWPADRSDDDLRLLIEGLKADLEFFGIDLIGGDTTSSQIDIVLSLTVIGECQHKNGPIRRNGLKDGDDIWVTGTIGDAFLGLRISQSSEQSERWNGLKYAYHVPALPCSEVVDGLVKFANGSMDVSDGLIADATHMATASGMQIQIWEHLIPVSDAAMAYLAHHADTELMDLVSGGDDYQVLFGASKSQRNQIEDFGASSGLCISRIGEARNGAGATVLDIYGKAVKVLISGWEHGKTV